jgi:hypothetical protein
MTLIYDEETLYIQVQLIQGGGGGEGVTLGLTFSNCSPTPQKSYVCVYIRKLEKS